MDIIKKLLREIPLFRHLSDEEVSRLKQMARLANVRKGQIFDLKKTASFNIVISGFFEMGSPGGADVIHCAPGSFFGAVPFTGNRQHGTVRAVADSSILVLGEEDMNRFFLLSFKGLRGYLRALNRFGFGISDTGRIFSGEKSRVLTVFSPGMGTGKSFLSALLGTALAQRENQKTIILDLSYKGESVFSLFNEKITLPISQKEQDFSSFEQMLNERIARVDETLHLFNIASGSKLRVDPDIISPILFFLSREYRYIICDCSSMDPDLRDRVFDCSDVIFSIMEGGKREENSHRLFDSVLNDGQRVYYVHNEHLAGSAKSLTGALPLQDIPLDRSGNIHTQLQSFADMGACQAFEDAVVSRRHALVLESNTLESVLYYGILKSLDDMAGSFDFIYTSSFSYIMTALYMTSEGAGSFRKSVLSFFSEEKLNSFLDITFPDRFIFRNNAISRIASDLAGKNRIEMFRTVPMTMLAESATGTRRIFSTGALKDLVEASFLLYPLFDSKRMGRGGYSSGYPFNRIRTEDVFRTDADIISLVSVNNAGNLEFMGDRVLGFYRNYLRFVESNSIAERNSGAADRSFVIEADENIFKLDQLLDQSEKIALGVMENMLKDASGN
jgi:predicted acylesterase/phospholipase RssA